MIPEARWMAVLPRFHGLCATPRIGHPRQSNLYGWLLRQRVSSVRDLLVSDPVHHCLPSFCLYRNRARSVPFFPFSGIENEDPRYELLHFRDSGRDRRKYRDRKYLRVGVGARSCSTSGHSSGGWWQIAGRFPIADLSLPAFLFVSLAIRDR